MTWMPELKKGKAPSEPSLPSFVQSAPTINLGWEAPAKDEKK